MCTISRLSLGKIKLFFNKIKEWTIWNKLTLSSSPDANKLTEKWNLTGKEIVHCGLTYCIELLSFELALAMSPDQLPNYVLLVVIYFDTNDNLLIVHILLWMAYPGIIVIKGSKLHPQVTIQGKKK
jgi:hypothetical protein